MPLRKVNDSQQLQTAINQILDQLQLYPPGQSWDFKGNRITNAGPSVNPNDYITRGELGALVAALPTSSTQTSGGTVPFTILFTPPDGIADGTISPSYVVGIGRSGKPNQVWLRCTTAPTTTTLAIQILYNGVGILTDNLSITMGNTGPTLTSTFLLPVPLFALMSDVQVQVVTSGGALGISVGVVVQAVPLR